MPWTPYEQVNMSKSSKNSKVYPWKLAVFPLLMLVFFIAGVLTSNLVISILLVIIAGVWLSFSIHIFFHECVHFRSEYPQWINIIKTLFLGLPFDGYRVHHYNHHTHANGIKDFSSTWYLQNNTKKPFTPCRYTFGWLRQLSASIIEPDPFDPSMGDVDKIKQRIHAQKVALFLFCIALAFIGLKAFLLYFLLVYSGWAFSALHNYGQHPPIEDEVICTYANKGYNRFFFNNGLHAEHHNKPWLSWNELILENNSHLILLPHLIAPCYYSNKSNDTRI